MPNFEQKPGETASEKPKTQMPVFERQLTPINENFKFSEDPVEDEILSHIYYSQENLKANTVKIIRLEEANEGYEAAIKSKEAELKAYKETGVKPKSDYK
ncbi:MAG: hypothetical protein WCW87_01470 [Candidatus Paceibacterota bacterium]